MKEDFLYFLWQFQHFNAENLQTTQGKSLQILQTGTSNKNAGPDFSEAKLMIDGLIWVGNVEMHLKSSDWQQHQHQHNAAYDNVILHVVWQHDQVIFHKDGSPIPTLELEGKTNINLLNKYKSLISNQLDIPCEKFFSQVKDIYKFQMLDNSLMQRLQQKASIVGELLENNGNNWEETAYQLLAINFGFKVNSEVFLRLAQNLPLKIVQKHSNNLLQIEALLFGQAGLLEEAEEDEYVRLLKREHSFLSHKYNLQNSQIKASAWKLSKLRPNNFPTLRLAQWAAWLQQTPQLFSTIFEWDSPGKIQKQFQIKTSLYWQNHYIFGRETEKKVPAFGKSSTENVLMNSLVPLLVAYAESQD
ncbi:MAG: DUF2851 family protein, partial [Verrucomicrobia bacterium]|nr:DUF2851 family protein [Cytophagales bacterium]